MKKLNYLQERVEVMTGEELESNVYRLQQVRCKNILDLYVLTYWSVTITVIDLGTSC